jgi:hypothetical protein
MKDTFTRMCRSLRYHKPNDLVSQAKVITSSRVDRK